MNIFLIAVLFFHEPEHDVLVNTLHQTASYFWFDPNYLSKTVAYYLSCSSRKLDNAFENLNKKKSIRVSYVEGISFYLTANFSDILKTTFYLSKTFAINLNASKFLQILHNFFW